MRFGGAVQQSRRDEYRHELEAVLGSNYLRTAAVVTGVINSAFIGLDWYAFPASFMAMLPIRLFLQTVLVYVLFIGYACHPRISQWSVAVGTGLMLLLVIYATGELHSTDYYVGLLLFFVGMPVLLPMTGLEIAVACGISLGAFVTLGVLELQPGGARILAMHTIFLASAALTSIASAVVLDRVRFSDYLKRREIEAARDELKQLDEAKTRFSANIHHELRTPLTLTLAPLEAMLGGEFGEVDELQRSYLETMHKNSLRLLKLINNLLDHAKIEGEQYKLHRQPLELGRVIDEIVESARPLAERKQVALLGQVPPELPTVNADPDSLEKMLVNLVGNALKFTEPGGTITVSAVREAMAPAAGEAPVEGFHLEVADTGLGIPPDQLGRVFDRFAQVDASATRKHEGTGIGLSLVQELVKLHGGRIWATSVGVGHGAQFHVFLPPGSVDDSEEEAIQTSDGRAVSAGRSFDALAADLMHHDADDAAVPAQDAARYRTLEMERNVERHEAHAAGPDGERALLLSAPELPEVVVAEDNADMRRLLVHLLSAEFHVRAGRNGREALELVRQRAPALVLTDVMMPEMSGTELCAVLKGDPETSGIPVMLVTSKADRSMKIEGLELGADDYVTKPFHPRELLARARSLVKLRSLQLELAEQNAALELALDHLKRTEVQLIQSERLAAVGELAAGVAHEVNNPVNFALNAVRALHAEVGTLQRFGEQMLKLDWNDPASVAEHGPRLRQLQQEVGLEDLMATVSELVGIAAEGLERTGRLATELKDFGTPGGEGRVAVDLRAILESTAHLLGPHMRDAGVALESRYEDGLPPVLADSGALKQLSLNLLKNAAEALEETGGKIRLEVRRRDGGVELSVADDGPGIDPELRARIFEPFFTTKAAGAGSGLGLAICRRIVEVHAGRLMVESGPEGGTCFRVWLPLEEGDVPESA